MSETNDLQELEAAAADEAETGSGARADDEVEIEIVSIGDEDVSPEAASSATEPEAGEKDELADLRERHLRLRADFENFRKRAERERAAMVRRGIGDSLQELLPVADNLGRALAAPGGVDDLRRGVEMIARQFEDALRGQGVEPIDAVGAPFDPQLHEAVAREESDEVDVPTVVAELQRGYLYGNALMRPALVRVAMPSGSTPPDESVDAEAEDES